MATSKKYKVQFSFYKVEWLQDGRMTYQYTKEEVMCRFTKVFSAPADLSGKDLKLHMWNKLRGYTNATVESKISTGSGRFTRRELHLEGKVVKCYGQGITLIHYPDIKAGKKLFKCRKWLQPTALMFGETFCICGVTILN